MSQKTLTSSAKQSHVRSRDSSVRGEARSEVASHRRRSSVTWWLRCRLRHDRIGGVRRATLDARETTAVCALTLHDRLVGLRPHVHVAESDVAAGRAVRTNELDRGACNAVYDITVPVLFQSQ